MKKIVMFETPQDLERNFWKIKMISNEVVTESKKFVNPETLAIIKIEPVVIKNALCDSLRFYINDEVKIYNINGITQWQRIKKIVLYFWGTDPYCNEDIFNVSSGHPLYEKFKYLIEEEI